MTDNIRKILDTPFALSDAQIQSYRTNGFVKLKNVLSADAIQYMNETITSEVKRLNTQHLPLADRDTYGKAFLQIMNIWTKSETVKDIVFSKRLAKIASDLMGTNGVRLYHDQALYKEPGGGHTPWHADQYYWPLANDNTVTVWIPMQKTTLEFGPLEFSAKSHTLGMGRNVEIGDASQEILETLLAEKRFEHVVESFNIGEVSYHAGWLFHRAGPNKTDKMRGVMTMIYMDKDMRLKTPVNINQMTDMKSWCPEAVVGEIINTPINPILYQK